MIALGVLLGCPIAFFVPVQIMFSSLSNLWTFTAKHPVLSELLFRTLLMLLVAVIPASVPNLSLLLSLIGSVCCNVIAFVLPVLSEMSILHNGPNGIGFWYWLKNSLIIIIAIAGLILGGGLSLKDIIKSFLWKSLKISFNSFLKIKRFYFLLKVLWDNFKF